jgi:hypothetical protein
VAIVAATLGVISTRHSQSADSVRPPASTTASSPTVASTTTTTTLDPSIWVTVRLELDHTSVRQGDDVTGTIVFTNRTGHLVALTASAQPACAAGWAVAVGDDARPDVAFTAQCIALLPGKTPSATDPATFPPGVTREHFRASTRETPCLAPTGTGNAPRCEADNLGPPMPAGPAKLWFVTDGDVAHLQSIDPVPITITPAGSNAQLTTTPDVVGKQADTAIRVLNAAGFQHTCTEPVTRDVPLGTVVRQTPAAGERVPRYSLVTLDVDAGSASKVHLTCVGP